MAARKRLDLTTMQGIAAAREDLYQQLKEGTISEEKANTMERILRGQTTLKGEIPLRYLRLLAEFEGSGVTEQMNRTIREVGGFMGKTPKQLE